jgi:transcriptional regulator with XRE-family HTH domain
VRKSRAENEPMVRRHRRGASGRVDERAIIDSVGSNCAKFRRSRGLSLDALARVSGLSKGMLVQIEQRRTNPSIATLCRIANALNVGLAELLYEKAAASRVVRHASGSGKEFWKTPAGSAAILIDAARVLDVGGELWRWTLAPTESFAGASHPEGTQEFLYVIRGELTVEVAGEIAQCGASEALRVRADAPHAYRNAAAGACDFLMCVIEPIPK